MNKYWLLLLVLTSCLPKTKKMDNLEVVHNEIKYRTVKQVRKSDILIEAEKRGNRFVTTADSLLRIEWIRISQYTTEDSMRFAFDRRLAAILDSLSASYSFRINRYLTSDSVSSESIQQALEAYTYGERQGKELRGNIQFINDGTELLFTSPIMIKNGECLTCHGITIRAEEYTNMTNQLSQAFDFNEGDTRLWGIWSVQLLTKEIVIDL